MKVSEVSKMLRKRQERMTMMGRIGNAAGGSYWDLVLECLELVALAWKFLLGYLVVVQSVHHM